MAPAERALRTLRLGAELDAARLASELQQTAERLGAAARREARLADRHEDWCDALRACLAAVPIEPRRFVELDQRRRAAQASLERARGASQALRERDRALRGALARAQHREDGLRRGARTLQTAERTRRANAAAREIEDAWNARAAGAGG
jgi:hypothetical protein